jgi:hypothetical protein
MPILPFGKWLPAEEPAKAGALPTKHNTQDVAWAGFKNMKNPLYTEANP